MLFGYPILRGGLGNMLIPWADCLLWCRDNDARMIAPFWTKQRFGPILRGDWDNKLYHRAFVAADEISGVRRLALLVTSRRVMAQDWRTGKVVPTSGRRTIIYFDDMRLFGNLIGRHTEVKAALYRITRPAYRPVSIGDKPFIGLHVRLGDFRPMPEALALGQFLYRLPIEWYVAGLQEIRRTLGQDLEAIVFPMARMLN